VQVEVSPEQLRTLAPNEGPVGVDPPAGERRRRRVGTPLRADDPPVGALARVVLVPWALSRVVAAATILVAASYPFSNGVQLTGFWYRWDSGFYEEIGRIGYGTVNVPFPRWAFFPGLPLILRALDQLGTNADKVGLFVIDQLALLVALAGLYVLARRHCSARAATLSVWFLAFFPASFVFSMGYPSALFLACTVWAFVFVEDNHDLAAGLLAAGATLLRPSGFIAAIALVVAVRAVRRAALVAVPSVFVLAGWCAYCAYRTGDAFVFWTVKSRWVEITPIDVLRGDGGKLTLIPHVTLAIVALVALGIERRRLPLGWLAFAGLYLLLPFATGMVGLGRYTNECFPPFVAFGLLLERWSTGRIAAVVSVGAVGMVLFGFVVGRYGLVP
jgi:hypothetical protein